MTIQNIIRHKHYVLFVTEQHATSFTVTNRQGKTGTYYPKTGKLVFRTSTGKFASI